jgi:hypothetical protein
LSRVYGAVTNNNGFWIGRLDLLTPSFTVTLTQNYNNSQSIISRKLLPWLPRTLWILVLVLALIWFRFVLLILSRGGPIENTSVAQQWIYENHIESTSCDAGSIFAFTAPLYSNGSYPFVACAFVDAGMCLPSRCPAAGLHITIYTYIVLASSVRSTYFLQSHFHILWTRSIFAPLNLRL